MKLHANAALSLTQRRRMVLRVIEQGWTIKAAAADVGVALDAGDALAGAAVNAPELLDIDMDQLARTLAFVSLGRLQAEPAETAHPDPGQDARDRRERHPQQLRDLRAREAQSPERGDRLDPSLIGPVGHRLRRRAAIQQTAL